MKITDMPYSHHPILGMHPFVIEQKSQLKNLAERRQVEAAALQNLQRECAKGLGPGMAPSQALAAQLRAQQQRVLSLDVSAALISCGLPTMGPSKRNRP